MVVSTEPKLQLARSDQWLLTLAKPHTSPVMLGSNPLVITIQWIKNLKATSPEHTSIWLVGDKSTAGYHYVI